MKSQSHQRLLNNAYPVVMCSSMSTSESGSVKTSTGNSGNVQNTIERAIPRCQSAGLIEGKVTRVGRSESKRRYLMTLQLDGNESPLFSAERDKASRNITGGSNSRFIIRLFKDDSVLGELTKSGSARDATITYTLTHRQSQHCPIAYIRYEVPSVIQVLKEAPPRRAFLEVPGRGTAETKEPNGKEGSTKSLNFRGRGREASRKNMQLQSKGGRVALQFVKWDKDVFHLDFS